MTTTLTVRKLEDRHLEPSENSNSTNERPVSEDTRRVVAAALRQSLEKHRQV